VPIDTDQRGAPGWWLRVLSRRLEDRRSGRGWTRDQVGRRDRRPGLDLLQSYLDGDPPLPHVAEGWREALRPFVRQARMNYAELVVEACRERMVPLGFATAADDDRSGDEVAAQVAAANELDLRTADAFEHMLTLGDGYMIVGKEAGSADDAPPLITAEDPREVVTAEDPATGRTLAAVKRIRDEWAGGDVAYVYTPGRVDVATRRGAEADVSGPGEFAGGQWEWDPARSGALPPGFDDLVPVFRFRNRRGVGEYEPHLDVLDRINDTIFERVATAKYQAFRQRVAIGLPMEYPDGHPKAGQPIDWSAAFLADPGAFWAMPPDVTMWEGNSIDLGPIRLAVKDDVQGLAAVTRTPLYFVTPDAANGSAEGASTQREGLVYRVKDRRRRADSGLARVMATSFRMMGDTQRADALRVRVLWETAEQHSLTERMSAAAQATAAGLPAESVYTDVMGYAPDDLPRLQRERRRDGLYAALLPAPPPARPGPPAAGRTPAAPPVPPPPPAPADPQV
jgi:hypothetical protein